MRKLLDEKHLVHLSPRDRLLRRGASWREDVRHLGKGKFLTLWTILTLPALAAAVYRMQSTQTVHIASVLLVLLISAGFALALANALLTGRLDTNTGLYFRKSEPVRFWLHVLLLVGGTLLPPTVLILKTLS
jgi:hypothetical protein